MKWAWFSLCLLAAGAAQAGARSARLLEGGAQLVSAQRSSVRLLAQAEPPPSAPPLVQPDAPAPPPEVTVDPQTLPTGMPLLVTGGVMMGAGANLLILGVVYLLGGLAADTLGSGSSATQFLTGFGVGCSLAGAALIGSGAYVFFRGRAQRAAYNQAQEAAAVEGVTAGYEPRSGAVFVALRGAF